MNEPTNLATGADISSFVAELQQPKQEFAQSESIFDALPEETPTPENERETPPIERVTKPAAQSAAKSATSFLEMLSDVGNGFISPSPENRLSDYERENLEDSFEAYFMTAGIKDLPPSWILIITIAIIFAPKTFNAFQRRKEKTQIEKLNAKNAELQAKLDKYEKDKKNE